MRLPARWHEEAVQLHTWLRSREERTNYRRGVELVDLVVLQGSELESNRCSSSLKLVGFRLDERIKKMPFKNGPRPIIVHYRPIRW